MGAAFTFLMLLYMHKMNRTYQILQGTDSIVDMEVRVLTLMRKLKNSTESDIQTTLQKILKKA